MMCGGSEGDCANIWLVAVAAAADKVKRDFVEREHDHTRPRVQEKNNGLQ
jgi:hypothetical protein